MSSAVRIPLSESDQPPAVVAAGLRPALAARMGALHAAAMQLDQLDDRTTEIVRLRCAVWHNCRVCQSVRLVTHGERVLDESVKGEIADYEASDLTEREKVALRLADGFMTDPGRIVPALRDDVRRHFSDAEIVEILMDIIAWTEQKPLVALALDVPPAQIASLEIDAAGRHSVGATPI